MTEQEFAKKVKRTAVGANKRHVKTYAVCVNLKEYLRGNVYLEFNNSEDAAAAARDMNGVPIRGNRYSILFHIVN